METTRPEESVRGLSAAGLRYAIAVGCAAAIDLAAAWLAASWLGLPLAHSAGLGVILGGIAAYFLLEFWAFKRPASAFSFKRLGSLLVVVLVTLVLRASIVAALAAVFPSDHAVLPILCVAFGITFTINFLVNRFLIFARQATR
ncbi:MAG: GtrA family protein [Pseudomonadota bacterium]